MLRFEQKKWLFRTIITPFSFFNTFSFLWLIVWNGRDETLLAFASRRRRLQVPFRSQNSDKQGEGSKGAERSKIKDHRRPLTLWGHSHYTRRENAIFLAQKSAHELATFGHFSSESLKSACSLPFSDLGHFIADLHSGPYYLFLLVKCVKNPRERETRYPLPTKEYLRFTTINRINWPLISEWLHESPLWPGALLSSFHALSHRLETTGRYTHTCHVTRDWSVVVATSKAILVLTMYR